MSRPATNAKRLLELRLTRLCRGYLTLEERFEVQRLEKQERQNIARRQRYANDPEFRQHTVGRILAWKRARYRSDPEYRQSMITRSVQWKADRRRARREGRA